MDDQVLVGIVNRCTNALKQLQARIDIKGNRITKDVNGHSINVFHNDICAAVGQLASVQEMSDIRVIELRQYLPLQLEPRVHVSRKRAAMQNLDATRLSNRRTRAPGKVTLPHPAATQGAQPPIRP